MAIFFSPARTGDAKIDRNLDAIQSAFKGAGVSYATTLLVAASFLNGWGMLGSGFQAPGYRVWSTGEVELFGGIGGGVNVASAFLLPSSLAPKVIRQCAAAVWTGVTVGFGYVKVDNLGNVIPVVNSNNQVFLDGVRWVVGA